MTGEFFSSMVLGVVLIAVAFNVLYLVVRAAVRDGIKLARGAETENRGATQANDVKS